MCTQRFQRTYVDKSYFKGLESHEDFVVKLIRVLTMWSRISLHSIPLKLTLMTKIIWKHIST